MCRRVHGSDKAQGFLLEYFRKTAQTEKEQETYLNVRGSWDDLGARLIGRWRINDFQTQVERLPELRVDWSDDCPPQGRFLQVEVTLLPGPDGSAPRVRSMGFRAPS